MKRAFFSLLLVAAASPALAQFALQFQKYAHPYLSPLKALNAYLKELQAGK